MFKDASYAARIPSHTRFDAVPRPAVLALPAPRPAGLTWRHLATALLLLVALPVFAAAALASLPVALLVGAGGAAYQALALLPPSERS